MTDAVHLGIRISQRHCAQQHRIDMYLGCPTPPLSQPARSRRVVEVRSSDYGTQRSSMCSIGQSNAAEFRRHVRADVRTHQVPDVVDPSHSSAANIQIPSTGTIPVSLSVSPRHKSSVWGAKNPGPKSKSASSSGCFPWSTEPALRTIVPLDFKPPWTSWMIVIAQGHHGP